jgi:hypothetical protein
MVEQLNTGRKAKVEWEVRLIAFLLIASGVVGISLCGVAVILSPQAALGSWSMAAFTVMSAALFGSGIWIGLALWDGTPRGYKWAKIFLAAQIPNIRVPGFNYQFGTPGITVRWLIGEAGRGINFHAGPSISIYISPAVQGAILGANVFAIFALIYLMKVTSPDYARSKEHFGLL